MFVILFRHAGLGSYKLIYDDLQTGCLSAQMARRHEGPALSQFPQGPVHLDLFSPFAPRFSKNQG